MSGRGRSRGTGNRKQAPVRKPVVAAAQPVINFIFF